MSSQLVGYLEKINRCGLVGGCVSLKVGFESSKARAILQRSLFLVMVVVGHMSV